MPVDDQEILRRQGEMEAERQIEEPAWRDIAHIIRPDSEELDAQAAAQATRQDFDVFDSTPMLALDQFGGGVFGEATNPAERWMEISVASDDGREIDTDLANWGPVKEWRWKQASQLFVSMSPQVATFYPQIAASFADMGAFGPGTLYQEEWPSQRKIIDRAIPIGESYVATDIDGTVNRFHRRFVRFGRQLKERFGDQPGIMDAKDDARYLCIHAVYPNPDFKPGMLGDRGKLFASTYLSPDLKDFRVDKGYYEMPFHQFRWNEISGRAWPRGPGHNARADMNTLNEMERANLVATQFDAEPPVLMRDENSLLSAADIFPNAVLPGTLDARGNKLVDYLNRGDKNQQRVEAKTQQRREAIRDAFHYGIMQVVNRPQMTATEWMGWKEEKLRLLGPSLVRVQVTLAAIVARRFGILARAGQALPPPPELQGRRLAVDFISPMAKAQEAATGRSVMQWLGTIGQIAQAQMAAGAHPDVFDNVNVDGAARLLHGVMAKVPGVLNDEKTVAAIRKGRADGAAQRAGVEQAAQGAAIFADVAHAQQALSASKGRGKAA